MALSMNKTELVIQLLKVAIAIAFAAHFLWWSLTVLQRLPALIGRKAKCSQQKGPAVSDGPLGRDLISIGERTTRSSPIRWTK